MRFSLLIKLFIAQNSPSASKMQQQQQLSSRKKKLFSAFS
jgi:hypothetical protein